MKKSLIALAVAGAFAAPAFAASSNVDVYGTLRFSVDHVDSKAANKDNWKINDQTSRFGIKGSEDLGGGMKAVWQVEQQINATNGPLDNAANSAVVKTAGGAVVSAVDGAFGNAGLRNTFIGLAGGFGTVLIGRHDTPYKLGGSADLFADTSADAQKNGSGIIGRNGFDNRAAGTIAYVSPEWSGFHFAVATVPGEQTGAVAADGLSDAYSLVGVYANGPLKATLGYENLSGDFCNAAGCNDANATKFNIGYKIGDIGLGYTYERSDDGFAAGAETDNAHLASVSYGMGPITLAGQVGKFNNKGTNTKAAAGGVLGFANNDDDLTRWTLGVVYNLSKRTSAYAAYNSDNYKENDDVKVWTFGMNHSF